ncbi:alcohol dehydrogenase catalytic domain-containing protein [Chloroflexi bacterium TSY]|nr:alcohol dehydrogenase catalytic domain-containing protein [Chloroflexi bacterium TSY]
MVIPRDHEHCDAADQKLAGLEFLTGILIPGEKRLGSMDTIQRDMAFWQATLKKEQLLMLERRLRNAFGMPPAGMTVYAIRDERSLTRADDDEHRIPFVPNIRPNTEFENIDVSRWCSSSTETGPVLNKILSDPNILIRITRASICQSDRRVLRGSKTHNLEKEGGLSLGHEAGGYIVDPGPWQAELEAGTKVVILPHLTCGSCDACHRHLQNLCENMQHLGFHLNGTLAELMNFPYQCVFPVGSTFPDNALPLVEPLACVLRPLFRIKEQLARLSGDDAVIRNGFNVFTIYGAGPMGCLAARAIKRFWPDVQVKMVEPLKERRIVAQQNEIADHVVEQLFEGEENSVSFVASSALKASVAAVAAARPGGLVILFSGINTEDISNNSGKWDPLAVTLERIHRSEQMVALDEPLRKRCYLQGTSGYNFDDVARSVQELQQHYHHYEIVQNAIVRSLKANTMSLLTPKQEQINLPNAVEVLLSPDGVNDETNGRVIAKTSKALIKL